MIDFNDSQQEADFRARLRVWLQANMPADPNPEDDDDRARLVTEWTGKLNSGGWSGVSLPREYGGHGLSPIFDGILSEEIAAAGAPPISDSVYLSHVILAFGDDQQRGEWIPKMLSGEEWWCQGFSEPEAGSDLAGLRAKAVRDGDEWVISGQKTWTTEAQWADWCLLLARTDPEAPRHRGISAFAVRMDSPGVSVSPIKQSTGHEEFAEMFLDEVRVPKELMIGEPGQGWALAMRTVTLERGPADTGYAAKHLKVLKSLEKAVTSDPTRIDNQSIRNQLARSFVDLEILRLRVQHSLGQRASGREPGPESSTDKLIMIEAEQALAHLGLALVGKEIALPRDPHWLEDVLYSRAVSVYGGTEQIQKEILATRVLGLPRS
jgi:alkylation response protein AidB-like acyl-CoA dehydrogenase